MVNQCYDIGLIGLIFGTASLVLVVILYIFYFSRYEYYNKPNTKNKQFIVVRLASTKKEEDIDINNPPLSIDNTLLSVDDIILLKNQKDNHLNGLYVVNTGRGIAPYKLTKREIFEGCIVRVRYGSENKKKFFTLLYDEEYSGRTTINSSKQYVFEIEEFKPNFFSQ